MYQKIRESQEKPGKTYEGTLKRAGKVGLDRGNLLKTKNGIALVDPVVGAGGRFLLLLVDVNLEALAIAPVLPVGDGVADAV